MSLGRIQGYYYGQCNALCDNARLACEEISYSARPDLSIQFLIKGRGRNKPLPLFDITEATFLSPPITSKISNKDLLASHTRMLAKHDEDLAEIHNWVLAARYTAIRGSEENANRIHDYNFKPEELVLVFNKKIKPNVRRKSKPRYFGPMVVVERLRSSAYTFAEVNGAISGLKFAAFCLIPYHPRSRKQLEITESVDPNSLAGAEEVGEGIGAGEEWRGCHCQKERGDVGVARGYARNDTWTALGRVSTCLGLYIDTVKYLSLFRLLFTIA